MKSTCSIGAVSTAALFVVLLLFSGIGGQNFNASASALPSALDASTAAMLHGAERIARTAFLPDNSKGQEAPPITGKTAAEVRSQIAARAALWYGVTPYLLGGIKQREPGAGYRQDCSGFVSYAWGLDKPGLVTSAFDEVAVTIPVKSLETGDTLNNEGIGADGHMVLFWAWADKTQTRFWAMEMSGRFTDLDDYPPTNSNAVLNLYGLDQCNRAGTGCTLRRLFNWNNLQVLLFSDGKTYFAQRYVGIPAR